MAYETIGSLIEITIQVLVEMPYHQEYVFWFAFSLPA